MPTRKANAAWQGTLRGGTGKFSGESGAVGGAYSFGSRFQEEPGSNPEELLAAAHAACFSMAFSGELEKAGATPEEVSTDAACTVEKVGEGFTITRMKLQTRVRASGVDEAAIREAGERAKKGCPVSRALSGVEVELDLTVE